MAANRILIVEDDSAIAQSVALNLRYAGYEYMLFDDGKVAADALRKDHAYDLRKCVTLLSILLSLFI